MDGGGGCGTAPPLPSLDNTAQSIERTWREEYGKILAWLVRACGDLTLSEDALQEAFTKAAETWPAQGVPTNPGAWITVTARRKLIDGLRRSARLRGPDAIESAPAAQDSELERILEVCAIEDHRLRLMFTCCHPAIQPEAQIALTLRTLGGLSTPEIARAFLLPETTLAQRIVRAKNKIRAAGIPYELPSRDDIPERLASVLHVVYLIFNEGYLSASGPELIRTDLCEEAIRLARVLCALLPGEPEARGLLALLLLHHSRAAARLDAMGDLVTLEEQDRGSWNRALIEEGVSVLKATLAKRQPGPYQVQAAIAALHAESAAPGETDWRQIAHLYAELERLQPTKVVAMNRAVAVAMAWGTERGLAMLDHLNREGEMDAMALFHAARADLLRRGGRPDEARPSYETALAQTTNDRERRYLERRLREVTENEANA